MRVTNPRMTRTGPSRDLRVAVLGSPGGFTERAVQSLCESGAPPVAWLTGAGPAPRAEGAIPVEVHDRAGRIAAAHGVALIRSPDPNHPAVAAALERSEPDLLLIACLPFVVRRATRRIARLGALNLHPSSLPLYRGPDPVFWQLRDGVAHAGVTVHRATDTVDAGPIIVQRRLGVTPGISEHSLTSSLVRCGIEALVELLPDIERHIRRALPQDDEAATYQPRRRAEDFRFDTSWTAERAYRFIEGTRRPATRFTILTGEGELDVARAVSFDTGARSERAVERTGGVTTIRFASGLLRAIPANADHTAMVADRPHSTRDLSRSGGTEHS